MKIITDFHLHSRWSRACSKELTLEKIAESCEKKGIGMVGTADAFHPAWRKDIGGLLEVAGPGVYRLKDVSSPTSFLLTTEISCIYKRHDKVRRVHHVLMFPSIAALDRMIAALEGKGCNLKSDGRPIVGLDSEVLLKMLLDADPDCLLIPAHAWTPWFSVFGSKSGFDSLEECFGEMTPHVHAIETGLSSDPPMNWRVSALDKVMLVSNSDAHSLENLGREANVFEMAAPSYQEMRRILVERDAKKFIETLEFFPEEGKYHVDGHKDCGFWCSPEETKRLKGVCPKCGKLLTVGVLNRVMALADRKMEEVPKGKVPFRSIVPLREVIADALGKGKTSKSVVKIYDELVSGIGSEFKVLLDAGQGDLERLVPKDIALAIMNVRLGRVEAKPGYDGEFGVIKIKGIDKVRQEALF